MSTQKNLITLCIATVLTFGLAACGSSGSSDNSALDSLQETLDALQTAYGDDDLTPDAIAQQQTDLDTAQTDLATTQTDLDTAQTDLATTQTDLDTAQTDLATTQTDLDTAQTDLATTQTDLDTANTRIGSDDEPMSLLGMLAAATGEVTGLQTEVMDLMTTLGDETNPDPASTRGMLAAKIAELTAAMDRIGSEEDGTGLLGDLATERAEVTRLGGELDDANDRIAVLEAGMDPDQLAPIRAAAMTSKDAAAAAEMAADMAADEAEAAMANRATMQTGMANSIDDAADAREAATTAMAEAAKALTAYDAAVAAGDVLVAAPEQVKAEAAQGLAEAAQTAAETARDDAVADSMVELKIDGTVKSVSTAMVDLMAGEHTETINDVTKNTGKVDDITDSSEEVMGVANDQDTADVDEKRPGVAAGRDVNIGLVVDSDDDSTRVALIKSYIGERTVGAYEDMSGSTREAMKTGVVSFENDSENDGLEDFRLRSEGKYFLANNLMESGRIATTTERGVTVFSYTYTNSIDVEVTEYVRGSSSTTTTEDGETTTMYTYQRVMVEEGIPLPHGTDYAHIHYGVWASTGENEDATGDQGISELGIAFVQNFAGGMTEEMPNNGEGEYEGNWVANIQEADQDGDGAISRESGGATMTANFRTSMVDIDLVGLAMLKAEITGSTFTGDGEATVTTDNTVDLDTGKFEGSVNGAFFGSQAAEAGGVFDYSSDEGKNTDGAFRGAFGGRRTD